MQSSFRVKSQSTACLHTRHTMAAKILTVVVAAVAVLEIVSARPEPPSSYLPPARGNRPSSSYGAPSFSGSGGSYGPPSFGGGSGHGGGGGYDEQSEPAHYQFQYEVDAQDYGTQFGHQESRDGDMTRGSYHVLLPDGRLQTVNYEADQNGYRPQVSYAGSGSGGYGGGGGRGGGGGGYRY